MNCPDNYDLFIQHQSVKDAWLTNRPVCGECKDHIQEEQCFLIDGKIVCDFCIEEYKVWTEDLMS